MKKTALLKGLVSLIIVLVTIQLGGCAGNQKTKPFDVEKNLVAAGFTYKVAENDAMLAKMIKLPQHKLIRHERQGEPIWIYPDVAGCKCLYAGDEKAYAHLQKIVKENKLDARVYGGTGTDLGARETLPMQVIDLDDGMLPGI